MADKFGHRKSAAAEIKRNCDGTPTLQPWRFAEEQDGVLFRLLDFETAH